MSTPMKFCEYELWFLDQYDKLLIIKMDKITFHRSEERRVGKERVSTCTNKCSPYIENKQHTEKKTRKVDCMTIINQVCKTAITSLHRQ